jgi:capsular polysaccharide export protein
VYVGTSQAGLEALIQGIPVTCFGLPFYAGWGLTDDRLAIPRRQARPTLEQLVAAAYIRYCRYVDPLTDQRCDVMTVARQLARQKQQDSLFAGSVTVIGVPRRERSAMRRLLNSRWGRLKFARDNAELIPAVARKTGKLLVWHAREPGDLQARAEAHGVALWRIRPDALQLPCGDEHPLAQIRGLPCSLQQAQDHSARPRAGLLESCARYRQIRRYLKGMF